ncbi:hypothetical protein PAXRUDRAFT_795629 [Paxillus rubicundulus Ve08.2h10]|uniref:Uncharacterized protein n=1 Tax=Paxillus rubicundulus Ve08.2h10 TaxID=930991 RepID=A0A0D0D077_9AGAM|nr:hypothetical protein PAXRUDRAFT_795629 [Paxillus rubicundulus Ve08.2h10]
MTSWIKSVITWFSPISHTITKFQLQFSLQFSSIVLVTMGMKSPRIHCTVGWGQYWPVINCTNHVMVAILDQHDTFMQFPALDSADVAISCAYTQEYPCPEWHNGILAADGSAFCCYTGEILRAHSNNTNKFNKDS